MTDTADREHIKTSARTLVDYRRRRALSRRRVRAVLDAMAAEARRYLGEVFTENDPVTNSAVALVVRSDERLPDDYDKQTPRPSADTVSRLIVDVLGRALTIEITDAGKVQATGDTWSLSLYGVTDVRVANAAPDAPTFLVVGDGEQNSRSDIPFVRALADLIDMAVQDELRFNAEPAGSASQRSPSEPEAAGEKPAVPGAGAAL